MAGPGARVFHSLDKFPKVMVLPPVSRQMDGGFDDDSVPRVQLWVMTYDDAHPERKSARDRLGVPIAVVIMIVLTTTPLLEQKAPGSAQIVSRHSGLIPCPKPGRVGSLFAES